jgi:hypothetical protein
LLAATLPSPQASRVKKRQGGTAGWWAALTRWARPTPGAVAKDWNLAFVMLVMRVCAAFFLQIVMWDAA